MTDPRILVLLPNWIGDAVMATPTLRALHEHRQTGTIVYAGLPHIVDMFRHSPWVDELLPFTPPPTTSSWKPIARLARLRHRAALIGSLQATETLLLTGSFSSAATAWLAGCHNRMGYAREGRGFLLNASLPHPASFRHRHRVLYYLDLLALLPGTAGTTSNLTPATVSLELHVDGAAERWAADFLSPTTVPRPLLGVHLGASFGPSKRWPVERFTKLLHTMSTRRGAFSVLIVGGNEERDTANAVRTELAPTDVTVISAAGQTPGILELAALFSHCDAVLSTDSGPMHVAAAMQRPQVAIFTSTNPHFTHPWNDAATVVSVNLDCSPCFARSCPQVTKEQTTFPCHTAVDEELVLARLDKALS